MCLSPIEIPVDKHRPWLKRTRVVPCGKCDVCRQKAANKRTQKILNDQICDGNHVTMFVTLTYDNEHVPYVRKSFSHGARSLLVYRGNDPIAFVKPSCMQSADLCFGENPVERMKPLCLVHTNHGVVYDEDKVGVCLYSDLQKFIKRLRINLQRRYGIKFTSFYACSEYGETNYRPHFHLLIQCKRQDYTPIKDCVCSSWTFCDWNLLPNAIEQAKNAASYVSGYVSKQSSLPVLLQSKEFRPRHSHSLGFGLHRSDFALPNLLEKIDNGNFEVPIRFESVRRKNTVEFNMPVPSYVLHRYFPPLKGLSLLSSSELFEICIRPANLSKYAYRLGYFDENKLNGFKDYDTFPDKLKKTLKPYKPMDLHRNIVRLTHCIQRFLKDSGLSIYDYARYFTKYRVSYNSYLLKKSYEDFNGDWKDHYDNINDVFGKINSPFIKWDLLYDTWYREEGDDTIKYLTLRVAPLRIYNRVQDIPRNKQANDRILSKIHECSIRKRMRSIVYNY